MPHTDNRCSAKQYSDQMLCEHGVGWDMNDPEPPECTQCAECPKKIATPATGLTGGDNVQHWVTKYDGPTQYEPMVHFVDQGKEHLAKVVAQSLGIEPDEVQHDLNKTHEVMLAQADKLAPPRFEPPLFDGKFLNTGIKPGIYKNARGMLVVVEHNSHISANVNRIYTEYTPSGNRLRQVQALPSITMYRYPAGLDWSEWHKIIT